MNATPTWLANLGGRSFLLCNATLMACTGLLYLGKLTDGSFTAIVMGTVGAYIAHASFNNRSQIRADVDKAALTRETQQ